MNRDIADAIRAGRGAAVDPAEVRWGEADRNLAMLRSKGLVRTTFVADDKQFRNAYGVYIELTEAGAADYRVNHAIARARASFCYATVKLLSLDNYVIAPSPDYEYATLYYNYRLTDLRPWAAGFIADASGEQRKGQTWLIKTGNGWAHKLQLEGSGYAPK